MMQSSASCLPAEHEFTMEMTKLASFIRFRTIHNYRNIQDIPFFSFSSLRRVCYSSAVRIAQYESSSRPCLHSNEKPDRRDVRYVNKGGHSSLGLAWNSGEISNRLAVRSPSLVLVKRKLHLRSQDRQKVSFSC